MNPSRIFILRPVATTMLMVGILLAGAVGYTQLPVSALPEVDYPDHSSHYVLSRREPGRDGVFGNRAARTPVRTGARTPADDLHQLRRELRNHPAIQPQPEYRCGRTGSAAIHQCLRHLPPGRSSGPPIYSKTNPADTPILTLALTSTELPLSKVEDLADTRLAPKMSQLPGVGLVSISGGQKPAVRIQANPTATGILRPQSGGSAHGDRGRQCKSGQRELRRNAPVLPDWSQRPVALQQRLLAAHHRLQERCAGQIDRRCHGRRRCREHPPSGLDEPDSVGHLEHSAAAGREHHLRGGWH